MELPQETMVLETLLVLLYRRESAPPPESLQSD
jgi:hypothetical protein